jgi:hypothetical protein
MSGNIRLLITLKNISLQPRLLPPTPRSDTQMPTTQHPNPMCPPTAGAPIGFNYCDTIYLGTQARDPEIHFLSSPMLQHQCIPWASSAQFTLNLTTSHHQWVSTWAATESL